MRRRGFATHALGLCAIEMSIYSRHPNMQVISYYLILGRGPMGIVCIHSAPDGQDGGLCANAAATEPYEKVTTIHCNKF